MDEVPAAPKWARGSQGKEAEPQKQSLESHPHRIKTPVPVLQARRGPAKRAGRWAQDRRSWQELQWIPFALSELFRFPGVAFLKVIAWLYGQRLLLLARRRLRLRKRVWLLLLASMWCDFGNALLFVVLLNLCSIGMRMLAAPVFEST